MEMSFIVPPRFEGGCLRDFLRASGVSATLIKAVKNETGGFWVEDGPARTLRYGARRADGHLCAAARKSPQLWSRRIFR